MVLRSLLIFCLSLALQVPRQARVTESFSAMIVGQVVDGESGRPVNGAIVTLSGAVGPDGTPMPRRLTGKDGWFVFRNLRRGSYRILAAKPGYVDGAYGRTRPGGPSQSLQLGDGERTGDATVRVWRNASISGTVVDEAGERLIGVRVQAYRRTVVMGNRRYVPAGSALTDDRGIYRISGLMPGDYIVGAIARQTIVPLSTPDLEVRVAGLAANQLPNRSFSPSPLLQIRDAGLALGNGVPIPPPVENGRVATYPPTFHPNAPSADAATVIPLRPGAEHPSADLQLRPVPTVILSGEVVGPQGPVTVTPLRLMPANTTEAWAEGDAITTMTDRAGRYTFPSVPSGHYSLRLVRSAGRGERVEPDSVIWADLPVSVGSEDIDHLVVEAHAGVRIGGRVEFDGKGSPPLRNVSVAIEPADPFSARAGGTVVRAQANSSGEFVSQPLTGGLYYVRVQDSPSGWMFKSATADGRDVTDVPMHVVADTMNVVVTFTDRWSGLRGFVQNRHGRDSGAAVLVFPTDSETWASSGVNPRRVRSVRPNKSGEYSLNLPPGEYYVIAVPDAQTADWQDPAFLQSASRAATRVRIADGERRSQDLLTSEIAR
jgi:protocatechuate 3,4-dioxygenase beta subunit